MLAVLQQLFVVGCLLVELWMVPLLLVAGFLVQYGMVYWRGRHQWQRLAQKQASTTSSDSLERPPLEVGGERERERERDI